MKTDELIAALAHSDSTYDPQAVTKRIALGLVGGTFVALAAVMFWLKCQPLFEAVQQSWFWMKAAYPGAVSVLALILTLRLSRPGAETGRGPLGVCVVVAIMAVLALLQLVLAGPEARSGLWLGRTARTCSMIILLLSAPIYLGLALAVRSLAPTRLVWAGAAAGLLSGAVAATLYGLHCTEPGAAFVATWYSLGMAATAGLGALAGPWVLRW